MDDYAAVSIASATLAVDPTDPTAHAVMLRWEERVQLEHDLAPYLRSLSFRDDPVAAAAVLAEEPDNVFARATLAHFAERRRIGRQLAPYLEQLANPPLREVELDIVMEMTRAERALVIPAALSGRLRELGLSIGKLDWEAPAAEEAWNVLAGTRTRSEPRA